MHWIEAVRQLRELGTPGVLATVTTVRGHAPRSGGTKMVISAEDTWATIGGGNVEAETIDRARTLLAGVASGELAYSATEQFTNRLNSHASTVYGRQCCGGEISILLEVLPAPPTIAIAGMGHVGFEVARILSRLDVRLVLVDSRRHQLDPLRLEELAQGQAVISAVHRVMPETVMERLPAGSQLLIMTHDHAEDYALCDAGLRFGDQLGGIAMIGSTAKWSRFTRLLSEAGHQPETIGGIRCPVGLTGGFGSQSKEPALIAVAIVAELAQLGALGQSGSDVADDEVWDDEPTGDSAPAHNNEGEVVSA